ncbi:MAG: relaxase/mobilization nuclease domain-containing protein [Gammaproteobacteria bacterium]|nr:relaxase/mobilization nuclease domain-containing protein [Gammaproteobacteria bacterium]
MEQLRRTVQRVPEVMVKVLPRASNDLKAAGKHVDYISRHGKLALEADDGEPLEGRNGHALLEAWDLDIDDVRRQAGLAAVSGRKPPKLIHKLMFSMPAGTPPDKVLSALRNFAREQFWGQHRYVFVLHTDEDHPHVHLVLKAVSEQGVRLNIKKATLRHWRSEFARNLRLLGVPANATERAVRGQDHKAKKDGIYRASQRGDSTYLRSQAEFISSDLMKGDIRVDSGKRRLIETRKNVVQGWAQLATALKKDGELVLADQVRSFAAGFSAPRTDRELVARELISKVRAARTSNREMVR